MPSSVDTPFCLPEPELLPLPSPLVSDLEYSLQTCLGSLDLHITSAFRLVSDAVVSDFTAYATGKSYTQNSSSTLSGPIVPCWVELSELVRGTQNAELLASLQDRGDPRDLVTAVLSKANFEVGADCVFPAGRSTFLDDRQGAVSLRKKYTFVQCYLAAGRTFQISKIPSSSAEEENERFALSQIPLDYDSICAEKNTSVFLTTNSSSPTKNRKSTTTLAVKNQLTTLAKKASLVYKLRFPGQLLMKSAVQIECTPKRVLTRELICEVCEISAADLYCEADRAHFCTRCDVKHHGQNKLLEKHVRRGIEHSPYQFGLCEAHPTERYEAVLLGN